MVSLQVRREQVAFLMHRGISKLRACWLMGVSRPGLPYVSKNWNRRPFRSTPIDALEKHRELGTLR